MPASIIPLRRESRAFSIDAVSLAGVAGLAVLAVALQAQKSADGDWPMYARDLAGTKFSPLKQVTADNVSKLQPAWNLTLVERPAPVPARAAAGAPAGPEILSNPEVTPIVVNGVMYLLAAGNQITGARRGDGQGNLALHDPGRRFDRPRRRVLAGRSQQPRTRDVHGERAERRATGPGARLMALDAATGKPSEGFGVNGVVDIGVPWNGVPLVFKNVVDARRDGRRSAGRSARRHARVRRAHREEALGISHRAAARRTRPRHVAERRMEEPLRRQRLGLVHDGRRAARHPLYADRRAGRQLLGRRSSRQQSVRELDGRGRCRDRQVQVALPDRASRSVGLGHAVAADARGHPAERADDSRRSRRSARPATCSSSIA